ncbi:MAG: hypothetical protein KAG34_10490 [Cocleimonas sp.]|nr:hypothetical protein [Cocleimonas sp.]
MINSTNNTLNRVADSAATLKATLASSHSMPNMQTNALSPVLKNLLQLIVTLIAQLQDPDTKPSKPSKPSDSPKDIMGTKDKDYLKGGKANDHIFGFEGNDILRGRQGDDFLDGDEGNDRLYGGKGNDTLYGGKGNDYLSGGSGHNHLFGGAGDDVLVSHSGNDLLDGGAGNDTAKIKGNIADYKVSVSESGDLLLENKTTGKKIEAKDIENFSFNDASLSFDDLKARAGSDQPQSLTLSQQQHQNIAKHFNHGTTTYAGEVSDNDGSGTLSVGDTVKLTIGGIADIKQVEHKLTADDIATINNQPTESPTLKLSIEEQLRTSDYFHLKKNTSPHSLLSFMGTAIDKDGSGDLSAGDIVKLSSPEGKELTDYTLTADDIAGIKGERPRILQFTRPEQEAINNHFAKNTDGNVTTHTSRIIDRDGSNDLSAGDTVKQSVTTKEGRYFIDYVLTSQDIESIKTDDGALPNQLSLTKDQQTAIGAHFNRTPAPGVADGETTRYEGVALDRNGDGQLGVGDIVRLHVSGGFTILGGGDNVMDYVLRQADVDSINADKSNPLLDISNGLSDDQRGRLLNAISENPFISSSAKVSAIFDGNTDKKISVGDTLKIIDDNGKSLDFYTLTEDDLNRFLK